MIQDIYPSKLNNEFYDYKMTDDDICLFFDAEGRLLIKEEKDSVSFTCGLVTRGKQCIYLFSVDDTKFFLAIDESGFQKDGYIYKTIREIRDSCSGKEVFAVFTAYHLRKTFATILKNSGSVSDRAIQRFMGHKQISTTINSYVFDQRSKEEQAAEMKNALFLETQ